LALCEAEWSASRPGRFTLGERAPATHWIGYWEGPRGISFCEFNTFNCFCVSFKRVYVGLKYSGSITPDLPTSSFEIETGRVITKWSRFLLEKLIVVQLIKKFITLYGNRMFIIVFTKTDHCFLS
jgi:hypothetical protein